MLSLMLLLAVIALTALVWMAPERGRGPGGRVPPWRAPLVLLRNASLHNELQLTDEQKFQLGEALDRVRESFQSEGQQLQQLPPPQRRGRMQELVRQVTEAARTALLPLLEPQQQQRLQEILVQTRGPQAFLDSRTQTALKLTQEQIDQAKAATEAMRSEIQALRSSGASSLQENRPQIVALRKACTEKIIARLTEEQQKTWQSLRGKPFVVQKASPEEGPLNLEDEF